MLGEVADFGFGASVGQPALGNSQTSAETMVSQKGIGKSGGSNSRLPFRSLETFGKKELIEFKMLCCFKQVHRAILSLSLVLGPLKLCRVNCSARQLNWRGYSKLDLSLPRPIHEIFRCYSACLE